MEKHINIPQMQFTREPDPPSEDPEEPIDLPMGVYEIDYNDDDEEE